MTSIRILLVDDHPMLRLGVRRSLENEEGFAVAEEGADLASVRAWLSSGGKADVAILDRSLPDGDGLEVVPLLKAAGMKVIVLTVEDDDEEIRAAVDAGVDGYLLKSSDTEQIIHAIGIVLVRGPAIVSRAALAYGATVDDGTKIAAKITQLAAVGIIARDGV